MQRADQRKYHYIYKITRDDGRYYIGMHSTDNLEDGYFGSGKKITRSIKKHGKERHKKEILEFLSTREALRLREKQLITEDMRADSLCMNLAPGGGGGFINDDHAKKFHSTGQKAMMQNKDHSASTKKAWNNNREKMLLNCQSWNKAGILAAASDTAVKRRKNTFSERGHMQGEKNSQFGTCWVTKDSKSIKIKKEQLDEYLTNGYSKGRKINALVR